MSHAFKVGDGFELIVDKPDHTRFLAGTRGIVVDVKPDRIYALMPSPASGQPLKYYFLVRNIKYLRNNRLFPLKPRVLTAPKVIS